MALYAASTRDARPDVLQHDLRSWEVRTRLDGERLGTVEEVLLDEDGVPRHLEVELSDGGEHVLLPIGQARIHPDDEAVWVPGLNRRAFEDVPAYPGTPGSIDPAYEERLGSAYDRGYRSAGSSWDSPHYEPSWTKRSGRAETGSAAVREAPVRVDTLSDVDVADHDHDPRGWTVVGRDGERIGRVEHLVGDLEAMKVRYLSVELDRQPGDDERRILVPAGHVALEPDHERVRVDALDRDRVRAYPAWSGKPVEPEHELRVSEHLHGGYERERRYRHPRYRTDRLYG